MPTVEYQAPSPSLLLPCRHAQLLGLAEGGAAAAAAKDAPLVILDFDGTVSRKDKQHGNTLDNNLSRSHALGAIKRALAVPGLRQRGMGGAKMTGTRAHVTRAGDRTRERDCVDAVRCGSGVARRY